MQKSLFVIFLVIAVSGCKPRYINYRVTSDKQHQVYETNSNIAFIADYSEVEVLFDGPDSRFVSSGYSLFAVHDKVKNIDNYAVMFAPGSYFDFVNIDNASFSYSASILPDEIKSVISLLDKAIAEWDREEPDNKAVFYSFATQAEALAKETILSNTMTYVWEPSFRMAYNRTTKGSALTLFVGSQGWQFIFTITDKDEVIRLKNDIARAQNELTVMGMP